MLLCIYQMNIVRLLLFTSVCWWLSLTPALKGAYWSRFHSDGVTNVGISAYSTLYMFVELCTVGCTLHLCFSNIFIQMSFDTPVWNNWHTVLGLSVLLSVFTQDTVHNLKCDIYLLIYTSYLADIWYEISLSQEISEDINIDHLVTWILNDSGRCMVFYIYIVLVLSKNQNKLILAWIFDHFCANWSYYT